MALKAGLVGVNPKGVDKNGMPIGSGGSVDAYTKEQTNALLSGKADKSTLTANSKEFNFAYSGGKYGYKAGSTGDFHPFEEAGVTIMGWVPPADPSVEYLVLNTAKVEVYWGGYYDIDNIRYIDIVLHALDTISTTDFLFKFSDVTLAVSPVNTLVGSRGSTNGGSARSNFATSSQFTYTNNGYVADYEVTNDRYPHIFGQIALL